METKFDKKYLRMAKIWSENSHALRNKVGALLVKDNMIISDGFNGTPSGFENQCENVECANGIGCERHLHPNEEESLEKCYGCEYCILVTKSEVLHAEANAITKVAKSTNSANGSTLYVTLSPCLECAKLIIQSGIKRVVYCEEYRIHDGIDLLINAGVEVEYINIEEDE